MPLPLIISVLIGIAIAGLVTLIRLKWKLPYKYFALLNFAVSLLLFVLMYLPSSRNSWAGLGYLIMALLSLCILGGYLVTWLIAFLVSKNKKNKELVQE